MAEVQLDKQGFSFLVDLFFSTTVVYHSWLWIHNKTHLFFDLWILKIAAASKKIKDD